MQTIGLIGGLSWESSLEYYRIINETVKKRMGGLHSAHCILYSLDFAPIEKLLRQSEWLQLTDIMVDAAQRLKNSGADCIVICSNTMHKTADSIQDIVGLPVLHIADATAAQITNKGMKKVGLLGTKIAMEGDFYKNRFKNKHHIEAIIPSETERELVNAVIFKELCLGIFKQSSRDNFREIINNLVLMGAEGIVLGCTEIPLLIKREDTTIPIFDTMTAHATAAVDFALQ
jgi:aspartate racemase